MRRYMNSVAVWQYSQFIDRLRTGRLKFDSRQWRWDFSIHPHARNVCGYRHRLLPSRHHGVFHRGWESSLSRSAIRKVWWSFCSTQLHAAMSQCVNTEHPESFPLWRFRKRSYVWSRPVWRSGLKVVSWCAQGPIRALALPIYTHFWRSE
jgi:hypothetical protein